MALLGFVLVVPLIVLGLYDLFQKKHSLLRIYPVIGHGRYLFEAVRPEIQQYFVESNIDGRPFEREFRSLIYQRAKGQRDTVPFGTQRDVGKVGYEWLAHSFCPREISHEEPRVVIGGDQCKHPYASSHLVISAMSFGSLSRNAVLALNKGARMGGFAHNTGEGGISPYHLLYGGDLIWQVGTGYFGCRDRNGGFDPKMFADNASRESVKMIELKVSQGAKPGHGGILPGAKVTPEIAKIRGVPVGKTVISPPGHSTFNTPRGLLEFIAVLREYSGGKPIGFKLCVGHRRDFLGICMAMVETGIFPDYVAVDGSEGGTGAAPLELSNSVGMPMRDGVLFVNSALRGFGLRDKIKVVAAGKVATGFHIVRAIGLGADMCASARAMMFSLGCIQARHCNTNKCPVGIATQDPGRYQAIDVEDKASRVARFHKDTIDAFLELIASNGLSGPDELRPESLLRRVSATRIAAFSEVYEYLPEGCLLSPSTVPKNWLSGYELSSPDRFS